MKKNLLETLIWIVVAWLLVKPVAFMLSLVWKMIVRICYKVKIRKGLKNGTIVDIDGEYYEVELS